MNVLVDAGLALAKLREKRPLIHHITNFVTMTDCANATLAIGASPTMTDAIEEVGEMAGAADALVLNLGTLQQTRRDAMMKAGKAAAAAKHPIIMDPVGAGGTTFRTQSAMALMKELPLTIIRGNLSELLALAAHKSGINPGVDNHATEVLTMSLIHDIATTLGTTVVVTGAVDAVSDGTRSILLGNGCPMMSYVTGTGCMTTSLIGAFASVATPFVAAVGAITAMGIAGEHVAATNQNIGPGTFHQRLFDELYAIRPDAFKIEGKVLNYHE